MATVMPYVHAWVSRREGVVRPALPAWNSSTQTCQWQGVACENGRVVELRLPGAGLMGALPSGVLGNLTALRTLSLRWNALTGPIPDDVARMTELRAMYFQHNAFSGEVPAGLFTLKNLRIAAIGAVQHELVVPLRAYYFSKDEKLLVYDYMSMGSLSALLHGNRSSGRTPLDWEARSAIALSTARGVAHIHSTGPTASHGNIKSSNVLLTKSYEARVSDHGLPTLVGPSFSPTRVSGYRAPEVTDIRRVSQKADVYSFGVLLLELLTGKAPTHAVVNEEGLDLPRWVQSVVREEWTAEVFDQELLRYQNVEEEMVQLLQLAIDCSAQHPDRRPSMSDAAARIDEIRRSASSPAQHATTDSPAAPAPEGDEPSL
uniref:Uncharacterized protein n=1 Tax=Aegilops tauschii TaxID=37682 RepID=M8CG34_AEGTA